MIHWNTGEVNHKILPKYPHKIFHIKIINFWNHCLLISLLKICTLALEKWVQLLKRVHTLPSSLNSMNFCDFFHEFFQFSMNLGLAATFQIFKLILVFGDSFLPNSVQQTQIVVSTKTHAIHANTFSMLWHLQWLYISIPNRS